MRQWFLLITTIRGLPRNFMKPDKHKIIIICGPTGIGKTSVAIKIAKKFKGEIISADSMQIYKYMDIGTAKPTKEELSQAGHHFIDIIEPDQDFDAAKFADMAKKKIKKLHEKDILPIIAGGTGLYIKALTKGIFKSAPVPSLIKERLREQAKACGLSYLYEKLGKKDPEAATKIHPNDRFRIIRALEVFESTGKTISEYHKNHNFQESPFNTLKIGLFMDKEKLYRRIEKRVDLMIESGFLDEVKNLLKIGYSPDLKSMKSIGYRHMALYISGDITWDEAVRTMKRDTRRYAKRQFTWFKADEEIFWYEPGRIDEISDHVLRFLKS